MPGAAAAACSGRPADETLVFALDLHHTELAAEVARGVSRLDALKHAIENAVHAKSWVSGGGHRFALLVLRQGQLPELSAPPAAAEAFLRQLHALQLPADLTSTSTTSSSSSEDLTKSLDLGSLIAALAPLQQAAAAAAARHVRGGTLLQTTAAASSTKGVSSSSSSPAALHQPPLLRVVLLYCHSTLPAPVWVTHCHEGLAIDALHVHAKPEPGEAQQQLQAVFTALEGLTDAMAMRAHHSSLIFEATAKNLGKLLSCMTLLLAHPQQRRQHAAGVQPPLELSTAPMQPLPSDAANAASGVPIVQPGALPAAAAGGAWAQPLSAAALAGAPAAGAAAAGASNPWVAADPSAAVEAGQGAPQVTSHRLELQEDLLGDPWAADSPAGGDGSAMPLAAAGAAPSTGAAAAVAAASGPGLQDQALAQEPSDDKLEGLEDLLAGAAIEEQPAVPGAYTG